MSYLIIGCLLFFGIHSIQIVSPELRTTMVQRHGEHLWQLGYAIVAAVGLTLIVLGYGQARQASPLIYAPPLWGRHAAMLLMLPVFPLLLATYFPARIQRAVRHPMLIATCLWAAAHLLANGGLADLILFGAFGAWAILDLLSFSWRPARNIRRFPARPYNDVIAVAAGLLLYGFFVLSAHRWVTGVPLF